MVPISGSADRHRNNVINEEGTGLQTSDRLTSQLSLSIAALMITRYSNVVVSSKIIILY